MKSMKKLAFFGGALAFVSWLPACSSDGNLGDNGKSSDQNVEQGKSATAGAAGTSSASGGSGGAATSCADAQCVRAIECVAACDGPVIKSGCCPCDEGTFDRQLECGSGSGGSSGAGGGNGAGSGSTSAGSGGASGQAGAASSEPLAGLNAECVADACPENLTPVHFYGVAGTSGPQFCWCTIPCADNAKICPEGTTCTTLADGPGTVCFAPR